MLLDLVLLIWLNKVKDIGMVVSAIEEGTCENQGFGEAYRLLTDTEHKHSYLHMLQTYSYTHLHAYKWSKEVLEPCGQMRDEKLHAVVVRSTFPSKNVQSTPFSDHFWKLRCRKSARLCGAKHVSKLKCRKHTNIGPLFGSSHVEKVHDFVARSTFPSQKCKKTDGLGPLFDAWMSFCVAGARDCGPCQKWAEHEGFVEFQLQAPLHCTTLHPTTLHYTPLHYTTLLTLHYITPHCTTLRYIALQYTTLH